jgi:hypothetical protein
MTWSDIPWRPTARTLRQFAGLWLLFVGALAWRCGAAAGSAAGVALAVAAVGVGVGGLLAPRLVRPLFLGLTIATLPVGWLAARLLLAALYYVLFTPVGFLFRLCGRDALQLQPRPGRSTYWEPKETATDPRRYLRAF